MEKAINFIRPSEDSFREFFKSFYEDCKVSPANISYLESDGSACKVMANELKKNVNKVFIPLKIKSFLVL